MKVNEKSRVYSYLSENGLIIKVAYRNITEVNISESGNHRLKADNKLVIVSPKWLSVEIDADDWTF